MSVILFIAFFLFYSFILNAQTEVNILPAVNPIDQPEVKPSIDPVDSPIPVTSEIPSIPTVQIFSESDAIEPVNLSSLGIRELRKLAKGKISNFMKMIKAELITRLTNIS